MANLNERARQRGNWPLRRFRLGEEPDFDDRDDSTVEERLKLVHQLTVEQWKLAGLSWPTYGRSEAPGVVYQLGLPPRRIDLFTQISGATFDEATQVETSGNQK